MILKRICNAFTYRRIHRQSARESARRMHETYGEDVMREHNQVLDKVLNPSKKRK